MKNVNSNIRAHERELLNKMQNFDNYDDFDEYDEFDDIDNSDNADRRGFRIGRKKGRGAQNSGVGFTVNNPRGVAGKIKAQFDLGVNIYYTRSIAGAEVEMQPNELPTELKAPLAAYIFGLSDYYSGFALAKKNDNIGGAWKYFGTIVVGASYIADSDLVTDIRGQYDLIKGRCQDGDMLIMFYHSITGSPHVAWVRISCRQIAYSTLLNAISSDIFKTSLLRYTVADETKLSQFDNALSILKQSLFGRVSNDFLSPVSYKDPQQYQKGIIDIKLEQTVDKETLMILPINYDCVTLNWSIFVDVIRKRTF